MKKGLGARYLLAALGGIAAMVAGAGGHYHADHQTPKKKGNRSRIGRGGYGKSLRAHFDSVGINWSAKKNRARSRQNRLAPPEQLKRAA